MSPAPDLMEWFVHWLDVSYGVACAAFLVVATWAVAKEILLRRRTGAPLFGPPNPAA